ncbi:uncharacterized protein LOC133301284 [Gastrolobium bilobum]|uniref:uncharacterized protein LOC133301284 n=1 Tax=Gastrolobium bilobum TaxID=150636 RepID=UPI002AAF163B|nr:uncharacterized protein LOC133301284 [Gastrolobium bilobum]
MGKTKKKFIDKKKSATFQLIARDSSDPLFSDSDRVFVRVDNNPFSVADEVPSGDGDPNSIFEDAPDDFDDDGDDDDRVSRGGGGGGGGQLSEEVRREILELGFPDDGYNYLSHLREIKNAGSGSAFYHNPKFKAQHVPHDVKAYDASRLRISEADEEPVENSIYNVASKTASVRVQKAVDPDVAALLDDSDLSRFGSDLEDLEEDFVVQANLHEEEAGEEENAHICSVTDFAEESLIKRNKNNALVMQVSAHSRVTDDCVYFDGANGVTGEGCSVEKSGALRLLDEEFDLLLRQEFGTNVNNDDDDGDCYENYQAGEDESLAEKLKPFLNNHDMDDQETDQSNYKAPADDSAADVISRCKEYAEVYEVEDKDKDVVLVQESSDESEVWDCETIVSTYTNLDNHPGKIEAPEVTRKKKLAEAVSAALSSSSQIISLRGKEKLPIDFLPSGRKPAFEKVEGPSTAKSEQYKRKQHGLESKEEKKERKTAVKEERREARRVKKEMKGLYKCETHRAQRAAAVSGPSSIPLM